MQAEVLLRFLAKRLRDVKDERDGLAYEVEVLRDESGKALESIKALNEIRELQKGNIEILGSKVNSFDEVVKGWDKDWEGAEKRFEKDAATIAELQKIGEEEMAAREKAERDLSFARERLINIGKMAVECSAILD